MALPTTIIATLDDLLERNPRVVAYSEDEAPELRAGEPTGRTGIRVYVDEKRPYAELDAGERLPEEIEGLPVDVVAAGRPQNQHADVAVALQVDPKKQVRPLVGGISISGSKPGEGTGTLGYFVERDGKRCLLSCAHVLKASVTHVIQPGRVDGGKDPDDLVAELATSILDPDAGVDAAVAVLGAKSKLELNELGTVTGTATVAKDDIVRKSGRSSGLSTGKVDQPSVTVKFGDGTFRHQIAIVGTPKPFSVGGDSGSLVVDKDLKAVGLLKGGGDDMSYANPIAAVLTKLGATLSV